LNLNISVNIYPIMGKFIFSDSLGYEDYDDIKFFEILIVSY